MSQCVPSWDADDINPTAPRSSLCSHSSSTAPDVSMLNYEVAELTWENGQISMHGFGLPRVPAKPATTAAAGNPRSTASTSPSKNAWDKPRASGTLESIVNQATRLPHRSKSMFDFGNGGGCDGDDLVPWFEPHRAATAAASNNLTKDALVPCANRTDEQSTRVMDSMPATGIGTCMVGCCTRVGSCSGPAAKDEGALLPRKRARVVRVPTAQESSSGDQSVSGSATFGRDNQFVTLDTCDRELGVGYTSNSMGSPENTSSAKQCTKTTTTDDHDSVCHSRPQREASDEEDKKKGTGKSVSTKRSRAAAIHNQSERKRRDKINQRMKTLQKLVPNSSKTDKASMLDEVIDYLKQLQAQVQMINRMNMSSMMLPMTLQQQLQMSMMTPMGMGLGMSMGMGMGIDMSAMSRTTANIPGMPPIIPPAAFLPMTSWDASGVERMQGAPASAMHDPFSAFFACQSQPMTMDAYSRMAAMYQQLQQPPASNSKS